MNKPLSQNHYHSFTHFLIHSFFTKRLFQSSLLGSLLPLFALILAAGSLLSPRIQAFESNSELYFWKLNSQEREELRMAKREAILQDPALGSSSKKKELKVRMLQINPHLEPIFEKLHPTEKEASEALPDSSPSTSQESSPAKDEL